MNSSDDDDNDSNGNGKTNSNIIEQHSQQNSKINQTLCSLAKSSHFEPIADDDDGDDDDDDAALGAGSGWTAVVTADALDTNYLNCEITIDRSIDRPIGQIWNVVIGLDQKNKLSSTKYFCINMHKPNDRAKFKETCAKYRLWSIDQRQVVGFYFCQSLGVFARFFVAVFFFLILLFTIPEWIAV